MVATPAVPVTVHHDTNAQAIALAGPDVLVLRERAKLGMTVYAVPRTGGRTRRLLRVPTSGWTLSNSSLVASAQRVGVIVEMDEEPQEHRVYSGSPSGKLKLVRRVRDPYGEDWTPERMDADGDRLLLVERKGETGRVRASILDARGFKRIPWATSKRMPVAIAGRYVAVVARDPKRVELTTLQGGTPLATVAGGSTNPDLTADGRLIVKTTRGLVTAGVGRAQSSLANTARMPIARFAGASLFAFDNGREQLVRLAPTATPIGPRSELRTDLDADSQGVAWLFNGCVRYLPLNASRAAKSACPATEVALFLIPKPSRLRNGRAKTPVRCVAAPNGRCRGTLIARIFEEPRIVGRGRFTLPVGKKYQDVSIRFDDEAIARFKKDGSGNLVVDAQIPNGSVSSGSGGSSELSVEIDERS